MAFQPSSHSLKTGAAPIKRGNYRNDFKDGYLYYIRIKTEIGYFYKVGFTQFDDVNQRFEFKKNGDEKLIDYIFFTEYFPDAYKKEQFIHSYFQDKKAFPKYSNDQRFPLAGNGQNELYTEDIFELDGDYSTRQSETCKNNIIKIIESTRSTSPTNYKNSFKAEKRLTTKEKIILKIFSAIISIIEKTFELLFLAVFFSYSFIEKTIKLFLRSFNKKKSEEIKKEIKKEIKYNYKKEPAIDKDFQEFLIYIKERYRNYNN